MSRDESKVNEIPYGDYCYIIKEIVKDENHGVVLRTKLCPYYVHLSEGNSKCLYMNVDSEEDFLLDDQVKICGMNEEDNEIEISERNLENE